MDYNLKIIPINKKLCLLFHEIISQFASSTVHLQYVYAQLRLAHFSVNLWLQFLIVIDA